MSWKDYLYILKPPKLEDIAAAPGKITHTLRREKEYVDVLFFDREFRSCLNAKGRVSHLIKNDIVDIDYPEKLSFFKKSTFFNRSTGKEMMLAISGYPYGLNLAEIHHDVLKPRVEKKNYDDEYEITQKTIRQLKEAAWTQGITQQDNSGIVMAIIVGILLGMVLNTLLIAFIQGG